MFDASTGIDQSTAPSASSGVQCVAALVAGITSGGETKNCCRLTKCLQALEVDVFGTINHTSQDKAS